MSDGNFYLVDYSTSCRQFQSFRPRRSEHRIYHFSALLYTPRDFCVGRGRTHCSRNLDVFRRWYRDSVSRTIRCDERRMTARIVSLHDRIKYRSTGTNSGIDSNDGTLSQDIAECSNHIEHRLSVWVIASVAWGSMARCPCQSMVEPTGVNP